MIIKQIIINATALGTRMNGIGVYLLAILKELPALKTDIHFTIYVNKNARAHLKDLRFPPSTIIKWSPRFIAPDYGFVGHLLRLLYANYLSLRHPRAYCFNGSQLEAMLFRKKQIVTVHDIIPLLVPRSHTRQYWYFKYVLPYALYRADAIITPSSHTKTNLMVTYGLKGSKIHVMHHGTEHAAVRIGRKNASDIGQYLLFVGRTSAHKNLEGMLRGFKRLRGILPHKLVVVGVNGGRIESSRWGHPNTVYFKGYVSDEEKIDLYRNAAMLVFPSYHEGFGLPPLEAMINSCPVVASKGTACIEEVCGDAAYYVDPSDIKGLADGIYRVATDESLRADLIQRGLQRARMFSWRTSAKCHVKLFERLLSS
jgi:glycosyltransferase involved in cell wall biosynthesis